MKLVRFGAPGKEIPGVILADGTKRSVSALATDFDESFFENDGIQKLQRWIGENGKNAPIINTDVRLGPPLARPSKIICVGLNYVKHAQESGAAIPSEPVLFLKSTTALTGPFDNIIIPKNSEKTDWEVELAVVIGKRASYVDEANAMDYIAGYVLHNDLSERAFQLERGGQWVKGKSADTFAPLGPFMATKDEIPDPGNLNLWLKVNGTLMQSSNTSDLIFGISFLISYISQFMTLLAGDVVSTGTPSGVGLGLIPPRFLRPGDIVELGIDGLGTAKQNVVAWQAK
jgi:2-keto-4-pentenoate hydratase/2-oxohepta-3-ene-1,7-dioic acid hydratase in catechol pathway